MGYMVRILSDTGETVREELAKDLDDALGIVMDALEVLGHKRVEIEEEGNE